MVTEAYPEDWNLGQEGAEEAKKQIKLEKGSSILLRIVQGPLAFRKLFFDKPDGTRSGLTLPFKSQVSGYETKPNYVFEVVVLAGPSAGKHKVLEASQGLLDKLAKAKEAWGDIRQPQLMVSRESTGFGKYDVQAAPCKEYAFNFKPELDLTKEVRYSPKSELDKLPAPPKGEDVGEVESQEKITKAQAAKVNDLCSVKELTFDYLTKTIVRKFGEGADLDKLTKLQASELITTLQGL